MEACKRICGGSANMDQNSYADNWIYDENVDLVAKTVEDFRTQRPSMVQNLSQFVLCYESILEWVVSQLDDGRRFLGS
jgi:protein tyrosine phosphatase